MGRARSDTAGVADPDPEVELTAAESRSVRRRSDRDEGAVRVRGGTPITPIGGPEDVDPRRHPRATAIGLAVAVPAVLGYNFIVRKNKTTMDGIRHFGSDLYSVLMASNAGSRRSTDNARS